VLPSPHAQPNQQILGARESQGMVSLPKEFIIYLKRRKSRITKIMVAKEKNH
jgi:hypothetical protein